MERVNATHMIVSWTALSLVEARGHIIYYTVNYWPASNSEDIKSINVPHNISRVEISHLLSGETYIVQVSANTSVGKGESAEISSVYSPPGIYSTNILIVTVRYCIKCRKWLWSVNSHSSSRSGLCCSSGNSNCYSHCDTKVIVTTTLFECHGF